MAFRERQGLWAWARQVPQGCCEGSHSPRCVAETPGCWVLGAGHWVPVEGAVGSPFYRWGTRRGCILT